VAKSILEHHGLIAVRPGSRAPGIYWLRLWRTANGHLAVVTEVPGNPGLSVSNGMTLIVDHLSGVHAVDPDSLLLYEIWPPGCAGAPGRDGRVLRVSLGSNQSWAEVSIEEIEDVTGGPLPRLPDHDDLYQEVKHAGGGVFNKIYRRIFEAVRVEDIPIPHNPSKCQSYWRFSLIEQELGQVSADGRAQSEEVGRRFIDSLTPADRAVCRYHEGRWQAVAEESVRIVTQLGQVDSELYMAEAENNNLEEEDRARLCLLFSMPTTLVEASSPMANIDLAP
jgi:hypothetical protein